MLGFQHIHFRQRKHSVHCIFEIHRSWDMLQTWPWTLGPSGSQQKSESESCPVMSDSLQPHGLYSPWNSPGQNTGMGNLSLLQGIFPTQG